MPTELLPWTRDYSQPGEAPVANLCRDFTCLPAISDPQESSLEPATLKA